MENITNTSSDIGTLRVKGEISENKAAAFAALEENPLSCVYWMEGKTKMSAIYWNGRRRVQAAAALSKWT